MFGVKVVMYKVGYPTEKYHKISAPCISYAAKTISNEKELYLQLFKRKKCWKPKVNVGSWQR